MLVIVRCCFLFIGYLLFVLCLFGVCLLFVVCCYLLIVACLRFVVCVRFEACCPLDVSCVVRCVEPVVCCMLLLLVARCCVFGAGLLADSNMLFDVLCFVYDACGLLLAASCCGLYAVYNVLLSLCDFVCLVVGCCWLFFCLVVVAGLPLYCLLLAVGC